MKPLRVLLPLLVVLLVACGGSVDATPAPDTAPVCGYTLPPAPWVPSLYPCGDEPGAPPHDPPLATIVRETPEGVVVECRCEAMRSIESACTRDLPGRPGIWARIPIPAGVVVDAMYCEAELDGTGVPDWQRALEEWASDAATPDAPPAVPGTTGYRCTPAPWEVVGDELAMKCEGDFTSWAALHARVVFHVR